MIFTSLSTIKDINKKIKEYEQIDKNNTDMENKAKKTFGLGGQFWRGGI